MAADGETTARGRWAAAASGDGRRLAGLCVDPRGAADGGTTARRRASDGAAARVARAEEELGRSFLYEQSTS